MVHRRRFFQEISQGTAGVLFGAGALNGMVADPCQGSSDTGRASAPSTLASPAFQTLPLGSIRPEGWLLKQLRIQADGLSGHLDEFWPDVGQSQWFGGKAEGWERAPYWLDGFIPLAFLLDDPRWKDKANRYVGQIIAGQRSDGWYAPYPVDANAKPYDLWAILLANKMLVQYHEATQDKKVLQAVQRNLKACLEALDRKPLFGWGKFRWFEGLISVFYVYERTRETWLLDLARKIYAQGFDYAAFYQGEDITVPTPRRGLWKWEKHVVNTGMVPKAYALIWRLTQDETHRTLPKKMIEILDRYHGQVNGMFSGDECLAGKNPLQGTELCAVVEFLYSLEWLLSLTGDPWYGDRLERVAFNALPATFAADMWSHQYDQQVNQAQCIVNPEHLWTTNGPESNIFGLEPNFGCCTSNLHQGWPKFAAHLWMIKPEGGLALMAYAPSTVQTAMAGIPVRAALTSDYPFRERLQIRIQTERKVRFPLFLRVPAWAEGATLSLAGKKQPMQPGSFHLLEQDWQGVSDIELHFPMKTRITSRYNGAVAVERGPLVYSLKIGEERSRIHADRPHRELPHGDFEVRPTTAWNYGLLLDEAPPDFGLRWEEKNMGDKPFSPEGAGIQARVPAVKLPQWKMAHGWAAETPVGEQNSVEAEEEVVLIPYGCTNLRITEFPRATKLKPGMAK